MTILESRIDSYRTGNYGEDSYIDYETCICCNKRIYEGEEYYNVLGEMYCTNCKDIAKDAWGESFEEECLCVL